MSLPSQITINGHRATVYASGRTGSVTLTAKDCERVQAETPGWYEGVKEQGGNTDEGWQAVFEVAVKKARKNWPKK